MASIGTYVPAVKHNVKEKEKVKRDLIYFLGPRHIDSFDKYKEDLPHWRLKDRVSIGNDLYYFDCLLFLFIVSAI